MDNILMQKKFLEEMKLISQMDNMEESHKKADNLMCKILRKHGYNRVVKVFENNIGKWYA